jgi:hypothetical protein
MRKILALKPNKKKFYLAKSLLKNLTSIKKIVITCLQSEIETLKKRLKIIFLLRKLNLFY